MRSKLNEAVSQSMTYRAICLVKRWTADSTVFRLLAHKYVPVAFLAVFSLASLLRVLTSTMDAPVKFLSFAILFLSVVTLAWNYTDPPVDL